MQLGNNIHGYKMGDSNTYKFMGFKYRIRTKTFDHCFSPNTLGGDSVYNSIIKKFFLIGKIDEIR